jgi:hypothetical protein
MVMVDPRLQVAPKVSSRHVLLSGHGGLCASRWQFDAGVRAPGLQAGGARQHRGHRDLTGLSAVIPKRARGDTAAAGWAGAEVPSHEREGDDRAGIAV